jgi:hypothetical protein
MTKRNLIVFAAAMGLSAVAMHPMITDAHAKKARASSAPVKTQGKQRCGWFDNPTPSNFWLTDKNGEWTIGTQGMKEADGLLDMPDMSTKGWVVTNGSSYGFGCACMNVDTDAETMNITRIYKAQPMPLKSCAKNYGVEKRKLKNYWDEN